MTRAKRADALLIAAKHWQMGYSTNSPAWPEVWDSLCDAPWDESVCEEAASAALSEASRLGFALVNADGSDCEKVARYAPAGGVRRGDGTTFALYERARRCS
jgi:hypothetical protein